MYEMKEYKKPTNIRVNTWRIINVNNYFSQPDHPFWKFCKTNQPTNRTKPKETTKSNQTNQSINHGPTLFSFWHTSLLLSLLLQQQRHTNTQYPEINMILPPLLRKRKNCLHALTCIDIHYSITNLCTQNRPKLMYAIHLC